MVSWLVGIQHSWSWAASTSDRAHQGIICHWVALRRALSRACIRRPRFPFTLEMKMAVADKRDFRLTKEVRPTDYELHFELDIENWTFSGREKIDLHIDRPTREIILHSDE